MDGEDVSQGVFGQFFGILYAMMVILVWEVFRWLMGHLTLLVVPQFNRQMVEQAELMVKLALKDQGKDVRGEEGHSTAAPTVERKDEPQGEEPRPGEDHRKEKRRKTEERDADRAHEKRERGRDRRRRGETGRSRSPHREKESTTRRSESEKSPGPSTAESQGSGRVPKGPIAPLPEGMKAPGRPPPKKPSMPTPKEEEKVPTDDEEWGKWKEQRGEKMADYLARMRSVYGKAIPAEPKEKPAETTRASSSKAAPKAAAYYEVDGGEWYWWDGAWGDKWEPKKKKKKKNKYTEAEWEQWYKEHPEEDTESSQTPRRPAEPETPPPAQRPRIRPGQDLIRRPEDPASWTVYMPEVVMREVEYIISGEGTAWMTKPPAVTGFEEQDQAIDMWHVPAPGDYGRVITRIHYKWRQNSFHPDHPTLPKKVDQLDPYRLTFLWGSLPGHIFVEYPGQQRAKNNLGF